MDCTFIERPGRWRAGWVGAILLLAVLPALPLLWQSIGGAAAAGPFAGSAFLDALGGSLILAATVAALALAAGLPAGILAALYEFPARTALLAVCVLPLVTPSFLWAIGWSKLVLWLAPTASRSLSWLGPFLVFGALTVPLVLWASYAAAASLSGSQLDAARLAGGEAAAMRHAARHVTVPALLAAILGGVLTLSDPGPDQIFGSQRAASRILASFSAQHDFELAARQCLLLGAVVLVLTLPAALLAAPRIAAAMLSRQLAVPRRARAPGVALAGTLLFAFLTVVGTALPLAGLALPLLEGADFGRALSIAGRTLLDTLLYAFGGGAVAVVLGFAAALGVGREERLRRLAIAVAIAAFSLPPALPALGLIQLGTRAPGWTDLLLRGRLTVCLELGLRFVPLALILGLRGWATTSPSWSLAAGVQGVPFTRYFLQVVVPHLLPAAAAAFLLVALLATADLTTVLLLHPPGAASLPLSIFTVMANARESLVASLCVLYLGTAGLVLFAGGVSWRAGLSIRGRRWPAGREDPHP